jgi:SAM-dependent methyltransferase
MVARTEGTLRAALRAHGVWSGRLPDVTLRRVKTQTGQGMREAVPVMAMTAVTYGLDQSWYGERDRLRSMSAMFDDTTLAWCERSGLQPGARVLELGAGAGSVAESMAARVGRAGRVVAVDRDTRFLADKIDRLEIVEIDILREPLPVGPFDLVHARMLLGHLGEPIPALETWIDVLNPGGWLVVEDVDSNGAGESDPFSPEYSAVVMAIQDELARRGFDHRLGLRLPRLLCRAGFVAVEAVSMRVRLRGDEARGVPAWDLLAAQLAPTLLAAGHITSQQYGEFSRITHDPDVWCGVPIMTTARGRRPR